MEYVAVDFETANNSRSSVCSIGIVKVKNGEITEEIYHLVDPNCDFDPYCMAVHGITPEQVKGKPSFEELWPSLSSFLEGSNVVAHNASYDMSVLRHSLGKAGISFPNFKYYCTYILSKRSIPMLSSYRLDVVASHFGIEFQHHNALEDARAAATVFGRLNENYNSVDELCQDVKCKFGVMSSNDYSPFSSVTTKIKSRASDIKANVTDFDASHPLYDKVVAFTGTLSMPRSEARQRVVDLGGLCTEGVTKKVNYLVIGIQDYGKFKDGQKSSKLIKAEKYISEGMELEIIDENDFMRLL